MAMKTRRRVVLSQQQPIYIGERPRELTIPHSAPQLNHDLYNILEELKNLFVNSLTYSYTVVLVFEIDR